MLTSAGDILFLHAGPYVFNFALLPRPYPFIWLFDLFNLTPSSAVLALLTFLSIGVTPIAAVFALARVAGHRFRLPAPPAGLRLGAAAFCLAVGAGFLGTMVVYLLRAPQVLQWERELPFTVGHFLIGRQGYLLLRDVTGRFTRRTVALVLAGGFLWVGGVVVPQHPWLVVWGHTLQDWFGG